MLATMLFALVALCAGAPHGSRLIEFNETSRVWMTPEKVDELIFSGTFHNFMDVTESPAPIIAARSAPAFPDQPTQRQLVTSLINDIDLSLVRQSLQTLSSFYTRYYTSDTGLEAAQWLYSELVGIKGSREDVTVEYVTNSFKQPSIIARIAGALPGPHSIVILGSHIDSVGTTAAGQAPGADDDGSGTVCNMEAFRVLVQSNTLLQRSVEFHFYAGEEAGLLGSQVIANDYAKRAVDVYSMMQLDMTMYAGTAPVAMSPITDYTDPDLTAFVRILIDTYCNIGWANSQCGYGCSDHASWNRNGYASCMPFETTFAKSNPNIHSARDTFASVNFDHGKEFIMLALAYLVELGNNVPQ